MYSLKCKRNLIPSIINQKCSHIDSKKQISCYREDGIYQLPELEIWIYQQAKSIAERFDARNGTDYFSINLELAGIEVEI